MLGLKILALRLISESLYLEQLLAFRGSHGLLIQVVQLLLDAFIGPLQEHGWF